MVSVREAAWNDFLDRERLIPASQRFYENRLYYYEGHADATEALLGALPQFFRVHMLSWDEAGHPVCGCGDKFPHYAAWIEHIVQVLREATT